jgi:ABC-type nitrate/sulfonate/bicarbonate transport system substrate-binding protein
MTKALKPVRIGFIPLVDAAALFVVVDKGFAVAEGLDIHLAREVSWSNVRDKLNIGQFDAAHLLAPMAIASSLGLGCAKVPIITPFSLAMNGNAITVSPALYADLQTVADGDLVDPASSARALARVVRQRKESGADLMTFGMTFPFSSHNYLLRHWMASGGVDPDEDVRLIVLPPSYMVESLAKKQVDGFCVGAPWNSIAVDADLGRILHFGVHICASAPEKVLALRESVARMEPETVAALTRALARAADFVAAPENRREVASILARPDRVGVEAELILRTLDGRLKVASNGCVRENPDYLLIGGDSASRPDPAQAAWLYAQMLRWGQARHTAESLAAAKRTYRADLYDSALGIHNVAAAPRVVGAFSDPPFDDSDMAAYLAKFEIGRQI